LILANSKRFRGINTQILVNNYEYQPLVPITQNNTKKFNRSASMVGQVPFNHQVYNKSNELENGNNLFYENYSNQTVYSRELQQNYHQTNTHQKSYDYGFNSQNESKKLYRTTSMVHTHQNSLTNFNPIPRKEYQNNNNNNNQYPSSNLLYTMIKNDKSLKNYSPLEKLLKNNELTVNKENLDEQVSNVMNFILSIFDSIDSLEKNKTDKTSSSDNNVAGIFPSHVISSIFEITVGKEY
jgi:hypothetical protein